MENAIKIVLKETRHRLCTWHIAKNATQHLASLYGKSDFKKKFNKCFHGCENEKEFQDSWDDMIKQFNLQGHSWLQKLYSSREKWCSAFSLDTFSASIVSTQRSESTNNVFHQISIKTMDLVKFVHHYEKKTKEMRLAELEEDYRCKNGAPHIEVRSGILIHGAHVYTNKMFRFFQKELMGGIGVRMKEVFSDNELCIYEAVEEGRQRVYEVKFHSLTFDVSCSCKLFESMGMLCRHTLKVFDLKNLTSIPEHYILKRWTKDAKKGIFMSCDKYAQSSENEKSLQSLRLSELMHEGSNVYNIASLSDLGTKIVKGKLAKALRLLEQDMETINLLEGLKTVNVQPVGDIYIMYTGKQTETFTFGPSHQSVSSQLGTSTTSCSHSGLPVLSVPFGSSDFYFTRLLHGNNLIPYSSQVLFYKM
ncbi:hypothetical protein LWI29_017131 [Acer saccharum]|uniref:Protein FAR1-RELATED SEQUENCE n=1 Tax=Acer saccharum TaxID=4024 RepID=A0AA39S3T6_ACESA|nr:hypothetical protein LWI29_017131 [Acer saccharum]